MILISVGLFLLGVFLAVRGMVALYGIIDLWYTIRSAYPRVLGSIVVWVGAIVLIVVVLEPELRRPFVYGLMAYAIFYSSLFVGRNIYFNWRTR